MLVTSSQWQFTTGRFLKRCSRCGANLGIGFFAGRHVCCPRCCSLLNPDSVRLGPCENLIVVNDEWLLQNSVKAAKCAGMLMALGFRCGASELTLEYCNGQRRLSVMIGGKGIHLEPPPDHLWKSLPDIVRALSGIDLASDQYPQAGIAMLRFPVGPPKDWPVKVSIELHNATERIILTYPVQCGAAPEILDELQLSAQPSSPSEA